MLKQKLDNGWALFRQALAGDSEVNYTEGSIGRATFLLAVPMILEMSMEAVFAIVDIIFVARLGTEAVATVGLTEALITLLYAVAIGLSMGATALVARRIGEKNPDAAAHTAGQVIWLGALVSCVVGVIGFSFPQQLLALMGAEAAVIETGANYTRLMFGASFTIVFLFLINAIFRGAGDATVAMHALLLANGINIVLDPCFIFGLGPFPELGVTGAAVATNIGRGVGTLYGLYYLLVGSGRIRLRAPDMVLQLGLVWSLVRVSLGGVGQFLVATASWVFLMQIVSGFGSESVAGYTIAVRIAIFTLLPAWGLSNAAATLAGQNLGAGLPDRAATTTWRIAGYNAIYMGLVGVLIFLFPAQIAGLVSREAEVVDIAVICLRIFAYGYIPWGFGMAIIQAFNGAGDTMTPTYINILCFWIIQVPLAYLLALTLAMGPPGVFWAVLVSDVALGIVGTMVFARGKWKTRQV
ncbi:MAG: MATE family efflux transporter [Pseudohongiellaceae bacterium]